MRLNELEISKGSRHKRTRVGRGIGSGMGKTSRRGQKGQKSRAGVSLITGFEGGQMPLYRRLPKRGFKSRKAATRAEVNLRALQRAIESGKISAADPIDEAVLRNAGLLRREKVRVKLIGRVELSIPLTVTIAAATKGAIEAIQSAGGTITTADATVDA